MIREEGRWFFPRPQWRSPMQNAKLEVETVETEQIRPQ